MTRPRIMVPLLLLGVAALAASCSDSEVVAETTEPCADGTIRACYPGDPASRNVGVCREGQQQCVGSAWSDCLGFVGPSDEVCDNEADDNCSGAVDEGCSCEQGQPARDCYSGPAATRGVPECHDGEQQCVGGVWSTACEGEALPTLEVCDGLDNDCTGVVDEGCGCTDGSSRECYGGPAGTAGEGECRAGTQHCVGGVWSSTCEGQAVPTTEGCDGRDNDCNGTADDGDPGGGGECSTGELGLCSAGVRHCNEGSLVCTPAATPSAEICDGLDQDCDGATDDGSFLPANYDSLEYIPSGWWGLAEGAVITWGDHFALWDATSGLVTTVGRLEDAWDAIATAGSPPPASGITSLLVIPAALLGGPDTIAVADGDTVFVAESGSPAGWVTTSVASWLAVPGLTSLAAATVFHPNEMFPDHAQPVLVAVDEADRVWVVGIGDPFSLSIAEALCPPGSTNCPPGVEAMARYPSTPTAVLIVEWGGLTYRSPFLYDGNGALYFTWSSTSISSLSCAH